MLKGVLYKSEGKDINPLLEVLDWIAETLKEYCPPGAEFDQIQLLKLPALFTTVHPEGKPPEKS